MTTSVRTLQIVCPGMKVPVRNEPNPNGKIKRFLSSEEVIEVFVKTKSGFYELTDNSVGIVNLSPTFIFCHLNIFRRDL